MKAIKRICEMEAILDKANYLMDIKSDELEDFRPEIERLEAYYTSRKWKYDYALDEAGKLPADLKRGVLSEDTVYNMLERYKAYGREE